jgi:hypothetical protein
MMMAVRGFSVMAGEGGGDADDIQRV